MTEAEQPAPAAETKAVSKPRFGVPVWRTGKPDAVLAAAVDFARDAVKGIAQPHEIGQHLAARTEGDRVVTHVFESRMPGYLGWQWYAVLTRNSRSKVITVNELGLLPSEDSVLSPEWIPWAERVRPEDAREDGSSEEPLSEQPRSDEPAQESVDDIAGLAGFESDEESDDEPAREAD
ncbi:DUF3027 domain-containing protein [Pseudarthrobacter sp. N5]|uniref:DUF3027 domain-containing protein n=1 Tax=Pseudarthrobacter sp. N5 TaxID=3418416 RepID=UPI003CED6238